MAVSTGVDGAAEACGPGIRIADAVGLRGGGLDNQFEVGLVDGDVVQCEDKAAAVSTTVAAAGASTPVSEGGLERAVPPVARIQWLRRR